MCTRKHTAVERNTKVLAKWIKTPRYCLMKVVLNARLQMLWNIKVGGEAREGESISSSGIVSGLVAAS